MFTWRHLAGFRGDNNVDDLVRYIEDEPASGGANTQTKATKNNASSKKQFSAPTPVPASADSPPARQSSPASNGAKKARRKKHSQHNAPSVADVTSVRVDASVTSAETSKSPSDAKRGLFSDDVGVKRQGESKRGANEAATTNNTKKSHKQTKRRQPRRRKNQQQQPRDVIGQEVANSEKQRQECR